MSLFTYETFWDSGKILNQKQSIAYRYTNNFWSLWYSPASYEKDDSVIRIFDNQENEQELLNTCTKINPPLEARVIPDFIVIGEIIESVQLSPLMSCISY